MTWQHLQQKQAVAVADLNDMVTKINSHYSVLLVVIQTGTGLNAAFESLYVECLYASLHKDDT